MTTYVTQCHKCVRCAGGLLALCTLVCPWQLAQLQDQHFFAPGKELSRSRSDTDVDAGQTVSIGVLLWIIEAFQS